MKEVEGDSHVARGGMFQAQGPVQRLRLGAYWDVLGSAKSSDGWSGRTEGSMVVLSAEGPSTWDFAAMAMTLGSTPSGGCSS